MEAQSHGGALKRKKAEPVEIADRDMLQLLQDVALGRVDATNLQVRAAIAAVQYTHTKKGDGGKKEEEADKAKKAGAGKFAAAAPPKLVAAGGKKV
jgi:phage terminase small subunit